MQVAGSPPIFGMDFEHFKLLMGELSAVRGFAKTWWDQGWTGTHAKDAGTILSALAQSTDRFIEEYLLRR